jgi:hypothetical protein
MSALFCFGLGYSARALGDRLRARNWTVTGTSRAGAGGTIAFDGERDLPGGALDGVTHILVSAPPDAGGDPVLRRCRDELIARAHQLAWVGYLSTTGVYGDHGGGWVDEETPRAPLSDRAIRRAEAEDAWLALARDHGVATHVFRLAGIYGPGRNQLEAVLNGTAKRIVKPNQVFSRIHVADIAGVLEASIANPNPGRVYNVADDEPAPPQDVVAFAGGTAGPAGAARSAVRRGRIVADGAQLLCRVEARRQPPDQAGTGLHTGLPDLSGGPHGAVSDMTARRSAAAVMVARSRSVDSLWSPPLMSVNATLSPVIAR